MDKLELMLSHCRLLALTLLRKRDTSVSSVDSSSSVLLDDSADPHPSLAEQLLHDLITSGFTQDNNSCFSLVVLLFASADLTSLRRRLSMIDVTTKGVLDGSPEELKSQLASSGGFMCWAFDHVSE
ncbi:unnamed protein product [Dicrocoelium dendriticum]|nr:unnamed protein product [Dicrocoelium dendriticum]